MYAIMVTFTLNDGMADQFMPIMKTQAQNSMAKEEGCLQFDVLCHSDNLDMVSLYEVYRDKNAFDYHLKTSHYSEFSGKIQKIVKDKLVTHYDQHFAGA